MKDHHTITIRIPTKLLLYVAAGVLIGIAVGLMLLALQAAGVELLTPLAGLPLLTGRTAAETAHASPVPVEQPDNVISAHPAVVTWMRVPLHIRQSLDDMVDRVLIEKVRAA